jgi:hypothetical protein
MKKHAACEHRMEHSLHPRLCEYLFEAENALLTVSRAVGNGPGSPILQLETTEGVKGSSSTHGKGSYDNNIDT